MSETTILTNEQLKQVATTLEENKNDTDKLMEKIEEEHKNEDNSKFPLEEGKGQYISDGVIIGDDTDDSDTNISNFDNININIDDLVEKNLKDTLGDKFNMTDEEVLLFNSIIARVRNDEKFNIYNELPTNLKDYINELLNEQGIPQKDRHLYANGMAKMFIDELISDSEFDAVSVDLEKAMNELVPAPNEMYSEINREYIEDEFIKTVDKIKEELKDETDPEKIEKFTNVSNNLLGMRQGYIDAYKYEPMYELFKNFKVLNKVRKAEKQWKLTNELYLKLADKCKFKLYSLDDICTSLIKLGFTKQAAMRLLTLFVYVYTDNIEDYKDEKEYNDIYRNSFANYFEINITNLSISANLVSDFGKEIKENLFNLSNHIEEEVSKREKELSNNKKKRR